MILDECFAILPKTPAVLTALLAGLPETLTKATEGPGTWSPYDVIGHLIHGEKTDWLPRIQMILEHGTSRPFDPFDMEAQFRDTQGKSLAELLSEFAALRLDNLSRLTALHLEPAQLELQGTHPALGAVTIGQLLAAWTTHDLAHIVQISRVMARYYRHDVGPFGQYLSVMR